MQARYFRKDLRTRLMKRPSLFARFLLFITALIVALGFWSCGSTKPEPTYPAMVGYSELVGVKTAPERKLDSLSRVYPEIAPYIATTQTMAPKRTSTGLFGLRNSGKYKDQRRYNIVIDSNNKDKSKSKASGAAVIAANVDSGATVVTSNAPIKQGKAAVQVQGDGNTVTQPAKKLPVGIIVGATLLVTGLGYYAFKIWQKKRALSNLVNPLV